MGTFQPQQWKEQLPRFLVGAKFSSSVTISAQDTHPCSCGGDTGVAFAHSYSSSSSSSSQQCHQFPLGQHFRASCASVFTHCMPSLSHSCSIPIPFLFHTHTFPIPISSLFHPHTTSVPTPYHPRYIRLPSPSHPHTIPVPFPHHSQIIPVPSPYRPPIIPVPSPSLPHSIPVPSPYHPHVIPMLPCAGQLWGAQGCIHRMKAMGTHCVGLAPQTHRFPLKIKSIKGCAEVWHPSGTAQLMWAPR